MNYEKIPSELKSLCHWVNASSTTKAPMQSTCRFSAKVNEPKTWSNFDTAVSAVEQGFYEHIGFVFSEDIGLVGIDIDKGYDDGLLSALSVDCLNACESYAEKSKSGRGIHIIVRANIPRAYKSETVGIELYSVSRYFIMTGKTIGSHSVINECQKGVDYLIEKYFSTPTERKSSCNNLQRCYEPFYEDFQETSIPLHPIYPPVGLGGRNNCMTSLAGQLHTQGYQPLEILAEIKYANQQACDPPLSIRELENIVSSVTRYSR